MLIPVKHRWSTATTCANDHRRCTLDHSAMMPCDVRHQSVHPSETGGGPDSMLN